MITEVLRINCPATRAFDLMADLRNETRWNSAVLEAELKTGEPIAEGSCFNIVKKNEQHDTTISEFNRPESVSFRANDGKMDISIAYVLSETDGVTTMTGTLAIKAKGLMAILLPLLKPLIRRDLAKEHANFVRLCETPD